MQGGHVRRVDGEHPQEPEGDAVIQSVQLAQMTQHARSGPSNPQVSTLMALVDALEVPVSALIDVVTPPPGRRIEYRPEE